MLKNKEEKKNKTKKQNKNKKEQEIYLFIYHTSVPLVIFAEQIK